MHEKCVCEASLSQPRTVVQDGASRGSPIAEDGGGAHAALFGKSYFVVPPLGLPGRVANDIVWQPLKPHDDKEGTAGLLRGEVPRLADTPWDSRRAELELVEQELGSNRQQRGTQLSEPGKRKKEKERGNSLALSIARIHRSAGVGSICMPTMPHPLLSVFAALDKHPLLTLTSTICRLVLD
jgi:hypothetical protein